MTGLYSESEQIRTLESRIFALKDEIERMKAEWIDPQRIVELAKRYTDEDKAGWVQIDFTDHDPTFGPQWSIDTPYNNLQHQGSTLDKALKEAEA